MIVVWLSLLLQDYESGSRSRYEARVEEGCVNRSFRRYESRVETGGGAAWRRRRRRWSLRILMPGQYHGRTTSQVFDRVLAIHVRGGELSCEAELGRADGRRLLSGCSAVGSQ